MRISAAPQPYIMRDQARDTVRNIMNDRAARAGGDGLLTHPSWLALGLLLVAFNIVSVTAP